MNKAFKITSAIFLLAAGVIMFIILYKAPFRLDDLTWGGRIGMERLQTFFQTQDGRYLGNLTVIAMTRIPAVIRIAIQFAMLILLYLCSYDHFGRDKVPTAVFAVLFFVMPVSIMSSVFTWTAGFANYFFSAFFTLAVLTADFKMLNNELSLKDRKWRLCVFVLIVFAGQFYLETATIYVVIMSVAFICVYAKRYHKASLELILQAAAAVAGALILFANPSYRSAVTHDGLTHKSIDFGSGGLPGMIATLWKNYNEEVVYRWFGMNSILNIALTIIVIIFCIKSRKKLGYVFAGIGILFACAFVYDFFDGEKEILISVSAMAVLSIAYYLYIFAVAVIFLHDREERFRMIIYMVSQLIFMGPFTITSPVTDRCLMMTYVFWCLTAAEFVRDMHIKSFAENAKTQGAVILAASMIIAGYSGWFLTTQFNIWEMQELRMTEVRKCVENHYSYLYLPKVADAKKYCYGLNIPQDDYWLTNYKDYYGIDRSCHLEFVNLNEWQIKRAFNR